MVFKNEKELEKFLKQKARAAVAGVERKVFNAIEKGLCNLNEDITVKMRGGDVTVRYDGENIYLLGDANKVYEGVVEY